LNTFLTSYHPIEGFQHSNVDLKQLPIYSLFFSAPTKTLYVATLPNVSSGGSTIVINEISFDGLGREVVRFDANSSWAGSNVTSYPEQFALDEANGVAYVLFDTLMDVHGTGPAGVFRVDLSSGKRTVLYSAPQLAACSPLVVNAHGVFVGLREHYEDPYRLMQVDTTGKLTPFLTLDGSTARNKATYHTVDVDDAGQTALVTSWGDALVVDFNKPAIVLNSTVTLPSETGIAALMFTK